MKTVILAALAILLLDCCGPSRSGAPESSDVFSSAAERREKTISASESTTSEELPVAQLAQAGQITAAEWNDLRHWRFWDSLHTQTSFSKMQRYWSYDLSKRVSVRLKNKQGLVLKNTKVQLLDGANTVLWETYTNNHGQAELWPQQKFGNQSATDRLSLKIGNEVFERAKLFKEGLNELVIDAAIWEPAQKLEIAYMVDATGSMSDELEFLKAELSDVIERVQRKNPGMDITTGAVFYRDEQDAYVTKKSEFAPNIDNTLRFIREQSADGGGDFPEAVHTALDKTLNNLQWSESATKLAFMVLDAPPHYSQDVIKQIHQLTAQAASKGIHLIPVVASGIDKETEFLMRYMAIASNGTYVFITDDSGIGNAHLEASVGSYQVEYLNRLMERLITESI